MTAVAHPSERGVSPLLAILAAGALATVAFDAFGQALSPWLGYPRLAPVPLANGVLQALTGSGYVPGAQALHYLAGLVAYPLGWLLIAQPILRRIAPWAPWPLTAAVYGVALWTLALYGFAHLVAGNPPFLGFSALTWVALAGHVLYALIAVGVLRWADRSRA